ncbi:MAG: protein-glutamate O-methyltransferase CheR [Elusimicrobiota bacterium]|jgi:chemotaxis protein methyltransferase CheR
MTDEEFEYIRKLIWDYAGLCLDKGKEYMAELRLTPLAKQKGFNDIDGMIASLRPDSGSKTIEWDIVEAMVTCETMFFRDRNPFELMKSTCLPELMRRHDQSRQLTVWCAACSSGQEPYSIALLIQEHFPALSQWNLKIVASDISKKILDRAREGAFSMLEINRGLPPAMLTKYFDKQEACWRLKPDIRKMVDFQQINLIREWPLPPFSVDIIFMRNVLIYFDIPTKQRILKKLQTILKPEGYLFLGGAETTINLNNNFERVPVTATGCYQLAGQVGAHSPLSNGGKNA